jgi:hypothetical protein
MLELLAAAVTRSPNGTEANQDRVAVFHASTDPPGVGVVVCDGVGGLPASAPVAERMVALAARHLTAHGVSAGMWELDRVLADGAVPSPNGATTLIALGADESGLVGHAFVGNGSLIEIDPVEPRPGATVLHWTDLVLPQVSWEEGRAVLRSFLPPDVAGQLEVAKGLRQAGDERPRLYLACSDGITTEEDRARARTPDGLSWREVPPALARLLDALTAAWPELLVGDRAAATALLERTLEQTLAGLESDPGLDDDASVGVVLLRPRHNGREAAR